MPQVTLTIGDRTYRLSCAEGEEPRIHALASHFAARVDGLGDRYPRMPADQLFLMAALLVTDELFEAREELQGTLKQIARLGAALNANAGGRAPSGAEMAQIVKDASARLDRLDTAKPTPPKSGSLVARADMPAREEAADDTEGAPAHGAVPSGKLAEG
ncbi:MAG: cell division protein ZapA [Dichotomicrobium sp.]